MTDQQRKDGPAFILGKRRQCIRGKQKLLVWRKEILQQKGLLWLMTCFYSKVPQRVGSCFLFLENEAACANWSSPWKCVCMFQSKLLANERKKEKKKKQTSLSTNVLQGGKRKLSFPSISFFYGQAHPKPLAFFCSKNFPCSSSSSPVDLETSLLWSGAGTGADQRNPGGTAPGSLSTFNRCCKRHSDLPPFPGSLPVFSCEV